MKRKIKVMQEFDLAVADCFIYPRRWKTSKVNGIEDNNDDPKMPCINKDKHGELCWNPIINLDNGQIVNWQKGTTASIHYKSVDGNYVDIIDRNTDTIKEYEGYVPKFLCPKEDGWGDYVIMDIDENGFIQDFNNNLDDIFQDRDDD